MPFKDKAKAKAYLKDYDSTRRNMEERKERSRSWYKNYGHFWRLMHIVGATKLPKGEIKREFKGHCEICGRDIGGDKKMAYHHWDDELLAMGMWLCYLCHKTAEGVEDGKVEKYMILKAKIEEEYAMLQIQKLKDMGILGKDWGA